MDDTSANNGVARAFPASGPHRFDIGQTPHRASGAVRAASLVLQGIQPLSPAVLSPVR